MTHSSSDTTVKTGHEPLKGSANEVSSFSEVGVDLLRVRVAIAGTYVEGGGLATHYVDGTTIEADGAIGYVKTLWTVLASKAHNSTTFTVLGDVDVIDSDTGEVIASQSDTPQTLAGAINDQALPPTSQALLRWRTGVFIGGKEIRGRTYVPALTRNDMLNGGLGTTALAAFNTAASAYASAGPNATVIYSRTHKVAAPISGGSAWTKFASLRSRRD